MVSSHSYRMDDNSCALLCLAYAFSVDYKLIAAMFEAAGRKQNDGCTDFQVRRVIQAMSRLNGKHVEYFENKRNWSYKTFAKHNKGTFILDMSEHLSYLSNDMIVDDYMYCMDIENPKIKKQLKLLGWWKLT